MTRTFTFQTCMEEYTRSLQAFLRASTLMATAPAAAATPAAAKAASLSQRSVAPSPFASLLGDHLSTKSSSSSEQRATLELCLKMQLQAALQRSQSAGESAAPLDSAQSDVAALLDAAVWCKLNGLVEVTTPLVLAEDAVESVPLATAEQLFVQLLVPRVRLLIRPEDGQRAKLLFIRLCNNLLRRLSKTTNTNFAGQISLQISSACPVDERSAINLLGKFNRDNVTIAESVAVAVAAAEPDAAGDSAQQRNDREIKTEIKMEDDSDATAAATVPASAAQPSTPTAAASSTATPPASLSALPPPPLSSAASASGTAKGGVALDSALYAALWGVQPFLLDPLSLRASAQLDSFRGCVGRILDCFDSRSLSEKESMASILSSSSGAGAALSSVFPKYLTGSRLLGLQLRDPMFRRHLLLQLIIFIAHLLNPLGNIEVMREILVPPAPVPVTANQQQSSAAAASASQLTQTTLSGAFLPVAELSSLRSLFSRALRLLKLTPPMSLKFTESFLALLGRENRFWISWKDAKCPPIERAPVAPAIMDADIDVEALARALREKRAEAANPAAAKETGGAATATAADSSARKRKAGVLGGGGGPFKGFSKAPAPSLSASLSGPGGRLYMGSANLAKLFSPQEERNQDALGFLASGARWESPDVGHNFIQAMLFEEEEWKEREEARKARHAERDASKVAAKAEKAAAKAKAAEAKAAAKAAKAAAQAAKDEENADATVKSDSDVPAAAATGAAKPEDGAEKPKAAAAADADAKMADVDAAVEAAAAEAEKEEEEDEADDSAPLDEDDAADAAADAIMLKHETRKVWQMLRLLASTPSVAPAWLDGVLDEAEMETTTAGGLDLFVRSEGSAQKLLDYFAADKKRTAGAVAAGAAEEELAVDEAAVLALQAASTASAVAAASPVESSPTPATPAAEESDAAMAAAPGDAASPSPIALASPVAAASEGDAELDAAVAASPTASPTAESEIVTVVGAAATAADADADANASDAAAIPVSADEPAACPPAAASTPPPECGDAAEEQPRKKIKREPLDQDAAVSAAIDAAAAGATQAVKTEQADSATASMDTA